MENNKKNVKVSVTPGFFTLLTIAFIVLKLCGVISWSWLWVLSPIWIWLALCLLCLIIIIIVDNYKKR